MAVIQDQKLFFDQSSAVAEKLNQNDFFLPYISKEVNRGFLWLADCQTILDYGCGIGMSLDLLMQRITPLKQKTPQIIGVDISPVAIDKAKTNYPQHTFYVITGNQVPQVLTATLDGVYVTHVLHHTITHLEIFKEINRMLKQGGKFFLCDLSADNWLINLGRTIFSHLPKFVQIRFSDDLVINGNIPEKIPLSVPKIMRELHTAGFEISEIYYGHLFFFLVMWLDKFIPLSKFRIFRIIFDKIQQLEQFFLHYRFFQKRAHVFCIKAIKA